MALERSHVGELKHAGFKKGVENLRRWAWWRSCNEDMRKYCKSCKVCKLNKSYNEVKAPVLEHPEASHIWQRVHINLIGPLPVTAAKNKYILTCIDSFTRFGICTAIPDKQMSTVARSFVDNVIGVFGSPTSLYSDRGLEFTGKDFRQAVKGLGVQQNFTTSFHPAANGLCERFNRTLTEILRCLTYIQPNSWDLLLKIAMLAYNTSFNSAVNESPYYLFFLRDAILPYQELLNYNTNTPQP